MAYKFENILQSPEYKTQFNEFVTSNISNSQNAIDIASMKLSELLVDGAILAQSSARPALNRKVQITAGSRRNKKRKVVQPKWHDISCAEAHSKVCTIARLVKLDPSNAYLGSELRSATKLYNRLIKSKHKLFVDNMFTELDSMQQNNPRAYMQLIKAMKDGNFDNQTPDDTSGVSPADWFSHFSSLLAKKIDPDKKKSLDVLSQEM